ncbi:MAG TPA: ferredoxin family protein [Pirellulales bacterium]|nr:ferredoxin family protein [Pirellulales bacterium]
MPTKLTVVVSQGQSANPVKRKLEEDIITGLLFERGVEVTVVPHLYDLSPDGTGMLCLQSVSGNMVVLSWLYPRAAHWTLDRNGIFGRVGTSLLLAEEDEDDDQEVNEEAGDKYRVADDRPKPDRTIYCIDLRARNDVAEFIAEIRRIATETSVQAVSIDLMSWIKGQPKAEQLDRYLHSGNGNGKSGNHHHSPTEVRPVEEPAPASEALSSNSSSPAGDERSSEPPAAATRVDESTVRRWYPVIDYSRCTNCLECLDFCLFGVYGISAAEAILVEQPDNCRKGCPACSRVCPENAIIFPQHKSPAIAGSANGEAGGLKIDLSKLFGAPDPLELAVRERDVELVAAGKDAVGMTVGIPKRQSDKSDRPKDDLDHLMDQLDDF